RVLTNARNNGNCLIADQLQGAVNLQLFYVFRQITRGHALVNVLVPSQCIELFNAGFDVVAGHALTVCDGCEVYMVNARFIRMDSLLAARYPTSHQSW